MQKGKFIALVLGILLVETSSILLAQDAYNQPLRYDPRADPRSTQGYDPRDYNMQDPRGIGSYDPRNYNPQPEYNPRGFERNYGGYDYPNQNYQNQNYQNQNYQNQNYPNQNYQSPEYSNEYQPRGYRYDPYDPRNYEKYYDPYDPRNYEKYYVNPPVSRVPQNAAIAPAPNYAPSPNQGWFDDGQSYDGFPTAVEPQIPQQNYSPNQFPAQLPQQPQQSQSYLPQPHVQSPQTNQIPIQQQNSRTQNYPEININRNPYRSAPQRAPRGVEDPPIDYAPAPPPMPDQNNWSINPTGLIDYDNAIDKAYYISGDKFLKTSPIFLATNERNIFSQAVRTNILDNNDFKIILIQSHLNSNENALANPLSAAAALNAAIDAARKGDYKKSFTLFNQSCEQGNPAACFGVGTMFMYGAGVPIDREKAIKYYERGCASGDPTACSTLGMLYDEKKNDALAPQKAAEMYITGCSGGDIDACNNVGWAYANGSGVPKDYFKAVQYYGFACDAGSDLGCYNLGLLTNTNSIYGRDRAGMNPVDLNYTACNAGDVIGCANLAWLYSKGSKDAPRNYSLAAQYFNTACIGGVYSSCNNLGVLYENGRGISKNNGQALEMYEIACNGGLQSACTNYSKLKGKINQ